MARAAPGRYRLGLPAKRQEAFRALKFVPTNGTLPSDPTLNRNEGGPCESWNATRGSPGGGWTFAVARYSSKFWLLAFVNRSLCIRPKVDRKTHFGLKFQASPRRGSKLFRSRLASAPLECEMAPTKPLTGSRAV